jgi:hypothetical protein
MNEKNAGKNDQAAEHLNVRQVLAQQRRGRDGGNLGAATRRAIAVSPARRTE